jgi:hypothetical protein
LDQAARELGIPTKILRAIEWDRRDLLGNVRDVDRIERHYAAFLGLQVNTPTPAVEARPPSRRAARGVRVAPAGLSPSLVLALLAPLLVITVAFVLQDVMAGSGEFEGGGLTFGVMLGLLLLSSLLFAASVLPPSVVERTPVSSARFARYRQPFALVAIGILVPVALFGLLVALT